MSDLNTIRQRIEAGDVARFYLDFYGSHWVELKSSMLIPFKRRFRLSPTEAMELRELIARRAMLLPPRQVKEGSYYRCYHGGVGAFFHAFLGNEIKGFTLGAKALAATTGTATRPLQETGAAVSRTLLPWLSDLLFLQRRY